MIFYTYSSHHNTYDHQKRPKNGRINKFSHSRFILFFISTFLRKIFRFKTMERQLKKDYALYSFPTAHSRRTICCRFIALPSVLIWLFPQIAHYCHKHICTKTFNIKWLFSDKSIFRAKGSLWLVRRSDKVHKDAGIIPYHSIDTDVSWAKSLWE